MSVARANHACYGWRGVVRNITSLLSCDSSRIPCAMPPAYISGAIATLCRYCLIMSSGAAARRLRLYQEILRAETIAEFACADCVIEKRVCFVMPNSQLKCAECVRLGRPCVNMSWSSLDKTRDEYKKKVEEDEKELAVVIARLLRNKKILAQAEERARKKALCLAEDMNATGESVVADVVDCPAADALVGLSPALWTTSSLLDDLSSVPVSSS